MEIGFPYIVYNSWKKSLELLYFEHTQSRMWSKSFELARTESKTTSSEPGQAGEPPTKKQKALEAQGEIPLEDSASPEPSLSPKGEGCRKGAGKGGRICSSPEFSCSSEGICSSPEFSHETLFARAKRSRSLEDEIV